LSIRDVTVCPVIPVSAHWPLADIATDRLEAVVDDPRAHGVPPEELSEGAFRTDERGIADMDGIRIARVRDPDDQVISIFEPVT
jgi:hypothetical protein